MKIDQKKESLDLPDSTPDYLVHLQENTPFAVGVASYRDVLRV